jgi:hypothetical protein
MQVPRRKRREVRTSAHLHLPCGGEKKKPLLRQYLYLCTQVKPAKLAPASSQPPSSTCLLRQIKNKKGLVKQAKVAPGSTEAAPSRTSAICSSTASYSHLLRQYAYFCAGKASNVSTLKRGQTVMKARQYAYFCTSKASKVSTLKRGQTVMKADM